jgi:SAM-dependent methyltransferase
MFFFPAGRRKISARKHSEWAFDRIKKVSDGHLQYSRFSSPAYRQMDCLACGLADRSEHAFTAHSVKFFVCPHCGTHKADNVDAEGGGTEYDRFSVAYFVYKEREIEARVVDAVTSLQARHGGCFLDVGCGLGFSVDAVRRLPGWTALGLEASALATFSKEWLGCKVRQGDIAASAGDLAAAFDVVFSQQLEYQPDPVAFIEHLLAHLKADGTLYLTMRGADLVYTSNNNAEICEMIAPGQRRMLFTEDGVKALFRRMNLEAPEFLRDATSLSAIFCPDASRRKPLERQDAAAKKYLEMCALDQTGRAFSIPAAARLFVAAINAGEHEAAEAVRLILADYIDGRLADVEVFEESPSVRTAFKDTIPGTARLIFCDAMRCLNHLNDPERAASMFAVSSRYGRKAYALTADLFSDELELASCADYHELLSHQRSGNMKLVTQRRESILLSTLAAPWRERIETFT